MKYSTGTTPAIIIPPNKTARWSDLHASIHDLVQILLEERLGITDAGLYTLNAYRYVSDGKSSDAYCMRFVLRLKAPGQKSESVLVGLSLVASICGVPEIEV